MTGEEARKVIGGLDILQICEEALSHHTNLMADLNAAQLAQGIRSDGSRITPEYAPLTVELKSQKTGLSGVTDHVTLYDEGDHYRELYAKVLGEDTEMGSKDSKSAALQAKYDGDQRTKEKGSIYGLTTDSKEELIQGGLHKTWSDMIESKTGLKFE